MTIPSSYTAADLIEKHKIDKTYRAMERALGVTQIGVKLETMYRDAARLFPRAASVASRLDDEVDTLSLVEVLAQDNGVRLEPPLTPYTRQLADLMSGLSVLEQRWVVEVVADILDRPVPTPGGSRVRPSSPTPRRPPR